MTDQGNKLLSDILQAIELIESFISDIKDFDSYVADLKTQSAVERQLGIIGEAVNKRFNVRMTTRDVEQVIKKNPKLFVEENSKIKSPTHY